MISGWSVVGSQLTATPSVSTDTIDWETCDSTGVQIGTTYLAQDTTTYTPAPGDLNTDICAVELTLGVQTGVSAVGPVQQGPLLTPSALTEGQMVSVTQGQWGVAATDVWYDCDASGANCHQAAQQPALGSSYLVTSTDGGATIRVLETPAGGSSQNSAWSAPTGAIALTIPTNNDRPGISGTAQVGDTLTVSPGSWSITPTSYAYQWQRCSPCTSIQGSTASTYVPTTADVGDTLEVLVTPTAYGVTGEPFPSTPTRIVAGVSSSPPSSPGPSPVVPITDPHIRAVGRLTATMRWTFRYAPTYTQIAALAVQGPALGSTIATRCTGKGCPFPVKRIKVRQLKRCRTKAKCRGPRQVNLEKEFHGHNLAVGSKITVMITRAHDIGKYYGFVVRRRRAPAVKISCLAPGSSVPGKNCTGL
jgi:hypothetical protein